MDIIDLNQNIFSKLLESGSILNTAILPFGSIEQHGEHLPFATDTIIVEYISKIVTQKINSFLLPSIYYGVSFEHDPLFNISINYDILVNLISDIYKSLLKNGIRRLYVINGHHGNIGLLQYVGQNISSKYSLSENFFYYINYWQMFEKSFDHAGEVETSIMMYICPNLVDLKMAKKGFDLDGKKNSYYKNGINMSINNPGGFIKFTKNGIWGNPLHASSIEGEKLIKDAIEKIVLLISDDNF